MCLSKKRGGGPALTEEPGAGLGSLDKQGEELPPREAKRCGADHDRCADEKRDCVLAKAGRGEHATPLWTWIALQAHIQRRAEVLEAPERDLPQEAPRMPPHDRLHSSGHRHGA